MQITKDRLSPEFFLDLEDGLSRLSVSQCGEDHFIVRHFEKETSPGFYLDVGAFHPKRYSNTYLLRKYFGWKGINIDANPEAIKLFEKEAPNDVNLHAAIDDAERDVELVVYHGAAHSTIDEARKVHNANISVKRTIQLRTRTLDSIVAEHAQGQRIDFLSVDVEGRDLQVLRSLDLEKTRPRLICIEDHEFVAAQNRGARTAVQQHLADVGYKFASHCIVSSFYIPAR